MSGPFWRRFTAQRVATIGLAAMAALILVSLAAPALAPQDPGDPLGFDPQDANHPPALTMTFLLGADSRGRSILALLLWGGRASLAIGLGSACLAAAIGVLLGALAAYRTRLDAMLATLMDLCQSAPPLLLALVLAARLGQAAPALLILVFVLSGWVAPARLTRAAVAGGLRAPYTEAARAAGVSGSRLLLTHLRTEAIGPVAAWAASAAAAYVALAAGLDYLGLGLPAGSVSWGTALAGAQDALAVGNWWWLAMGGLEIAIATMALHAIARGIGRAIDPTLQIRHKVRGRSAHVAARTVAGVETGNAALEAPWRAGMMARRLAKPPGIADDLAGHGDPAVASALGRVGPSDATAHAVGAPSQWAPQRKGGRRGDAITRHVIPIALAALVIAAWLGVQAHRHGGNLPPAASIASRALTYPRRQDRAPSYIATATYAATESAIAGRPLPWAAWADCPPELGRGRCAVAQVQIWYSAGQERVLSEGSAFVCTPHRSWGINPMAGLAISTPEQCGALGPRLGGLGTTAGLVAALLPAIEPRSARVSGAALVSGQRCWLLLLGRDGRGCVDAATGLTLSLERLDHAGQPAADFRMTAVSYGLDLAAELFTDPIPGGHAGLIDGLSQPLLNIQAADDQALFVALVPHVVPARLTAQTPTFESFYDDRRGYALVQRVRQAYVDRQGRTEMVLIETLPGSAWDATPPTDQARVVVRGDRRLLVWQGGHGQPNLVRIEYDGTAALISSPVLSVEMLTAVAFDLQ